MVCVSTISGEDKETNTWRDSCTKAIGRMTMSDPQGGEYIRVPLLTPSRSGLTPRVTHWEGLAVGIHRYL